MNIFKKIVTGFIAGLLSLALFGMAWANIGLRTIHDREVVKGWFEKSDFYHQVVDVVLEKARDSATEQDEQQKSDSVGSLPVNDPAIQSIAKQAFSPDLLKTSVESLLDGSYDWLDGTTKDIAFSIDLTSAKQQLADGLGAYVTNRTTALPVCTPAQTGDFDGFTATCRPSALSAAAAGANFTSDLLKQDFLKDPIITSSKLKVKDDEGREVALSSDKKATAVKTAYQRSTQLPLALATLSLLLVLGIVFVSSDRLKGIRKASHVFLVNGLALLILFAGVGFSLTKGTDSLAETGAKTPQQTKLMIDFAKAVVSDIKGALLIYTVAFIVIGIAGIVLARLLKTKISSDNKNLDEEPTEEEAHPVKREDDNTSGRAATEGSGVEEIKKD